MTTLAVLQHDIWMQMKQPSLQTVRLACTIILLAVAVAGICFPLSISHKILKSKRACSAANMLSAGAILSAALTHLLAEAIEDQPQMTRTLCLSTAVSFLFMMVMNALGHISFYNGDDDDRSLLLPDYIAPNLVNPCPELPTLVNTPHMLLAQPLIDAECTNGHAESIMNCPEPSVQPDAVVYAQQSRAHTFPEAHNSEDGGRKAPRQFMVFMWGLTFTVHSFIEGLALGAQRTYSGLLSVWSAIIAHKALAAMVVSLALVTNNCSGVRFAAVAVPFAVATPVGILVGWAVAEQADEHWSSVCSAVGAGTFLYIAAVELMPEAMRSRQHVVLNTFSLVAGFVAMSIAGTLSG
uniref:Zinc transporter n=1 Tax=Pyramimonas obovata TaxID=1411642 RepID=A0A7S0N6T2_9CHLO|mmetsp:Transcript_20913/g.45845  ORF Transcript_20913/g.45845 Transcript_20913/m.45845 type:complete len:352 (+) Transcript_20913:344-1399(+)